MLSAEDVDGATKLFELEALLPFPVPLFDPLFELGLELVSWPPPPAPPPPPLLLLVWRADEEVCAGGGTFELLVLVDVGCWGVGRGELELLLPPWFP